MDLCLRIKKIPLLVVLLFSSAMVLSQEVKPVKITELQTIIAQSKQPLVINFWATFCKPCIEEMPQFMALTQKYKQDSVQLLLVSLDMQDDYPEQVQAFVKKRKITASALLWLNETNADYFCPKIDTTWSGSIPASLFINNATGYRKFTESELSADELDKEIKAILPKK
jgi:thiol-disulfide isomerase/thioredoxin